MRKTIVGILGYIFATCGLFFWDAPLLAPIAFVLAIIFLYAYDAKGPMSYHEALQEAQKAFRKPRYCTSVLRDGKGSKGWETSDSCTVED